MCYYIFGDFMYEEALRILNYIESKGYKAYIVGGYPRDKYLGLENEDIDICTNMNPILIKDNFDIVKDNSKYGSMVIKTSYEFEITTFREDIYEDNRFPIVKFVDKLEQDLKRRDFIINTLCIDSSGNYFDLLGAFNDINKRMINTVGDASIKFKEDPLRIIRALRFSADLNFNLSNDIIDSINKNKHLLTEISKTRIKKELDKLENKKKGYELFDKFGLKLGDYNER